MLPAVLMLVLEDDAFGAGSVFAFTLIGAMLILLTPVFGGGVVLRLASTPGKLHLRPHGRLRVLLGSTLAITAMALVATLPALGALLFQWLHGTPHPGRIPPPWLSFQISWSMIALYWILMFALSRTVLLVFLFGLLPIAVINVGQFIIRSLPGVTGLHILLSGLVAWAMFGAWYLRAGSIRAPAVPRGFNWNTSGEDSPFQFLLGEERARPGENLRARAVYQYLFGCAGPRLFVITGLWVAAIFLVVHMFSTNGHRTGPGPWQLLFMLPFVSFCSVTMGYTTARRARFLWLRAGTDRAGLFAVASRLGLRAAMICWGVIAGTVALYVIARDPVGAGPVLLFVASQGIVAIGMFYAGLSLVRDWSAGEVLLCIGLTVLFLAQCFLVPSAFRDDFVASTSITLLIAAVLAFLLYGYAARQWRSVDWKLIRMTRLGMQKG
jgi:hypothetical protein